MSLESARRLVPEGFLNLVKAVGRGGAHEHRIYKIYLSTSRIAVLLRIKECLMDNFILGMILIDEHTCIILLTQSLCYLGHRHITLRHHAVADKIDGQRIRLIYTLRCSPITKVPLSVASVSPIGQKTVFHIAFSKGQPSLHVRIKPLDHTAVAIIEIGLP